MPAQLAHGSKAAASGEACGGHECWAMLGVPIFNWVVRYAPQCLEGWRTVVDDQGARGVQRRVFRSHNRIPGSELTAKRFDGSSLSPDKLPRAGLSSAGSYFLLYGRVGKRK